MELFWGGSGALLWDQELVWGVTSWILVELFWGIIFRGSQAVLREIFWGIRSFFGGAVLVDHKLDLEGTGSVLVDHRLDLGDKELF